MTENQIHSSLMTYFPTLEEPLNSAGGQMGTESELWGPEVASIQKC